ncbi:MAG: SsrA-binding protein SmpB [Candidatus Edwardsbacteria bacterium]|jgi:SsrA-binding protein|nr:SsrA-binding protein SmpB [Candidatus Edwardsbacteria bacterium]
MPDSIQNRKARHDYEVLDTVEAGLVLRGTEVKSVRLGQANFRDSYADLKGGELFLMNLHIAPYDHGNRFNAESTRPRKLLLHKSEIRKLAQRRAEQGLTLVPMSIYLTRGLVKVQLALARGRKQHDKRDAIKRRDIERELRRGRAR